MHHPPLDLFNLTCAQLTGAFQTRYGKGAFHARALMRALFCDGNLALSEILEFAASPAIITDIRSTGIFPTGTIAQQTADGVHKLRIDLHDGTAIESVIIPARNRRTLCVSSQAGCAMGCAFCATGAGGFRRDLEVREIVQQLFLARFNCGEKIDNIVFMGMGEPLDNADIVIRAIRVMSDPYGFNIPPRNMTVSTAGHIEGLERLARENIPNLRIAVSLNAPDDTLRDRLMPINRRYPLRQLKEALMRYPLGRNGLFLVEYVLLGGVNDSPEMAQALMRWVEGLPVRINLIAYNENGGLPFIRPDAETVDRFRKQLADAGVFVRVRQSPGSGINAACGQLAVPSKAQRVMI